MRLAFPFALLLCAAPLSARAAEPQADLRLVKIRVDALHDPSIIQDAALKRAVLTTRRQLYRQMKEERFQAVRQRAGIFRSIADGTYDKTRERIVYRGRGAIAFLDLGDSSHPLRRPPSEKQLEAQRAYALEHPEDLEAQGALLDPNRRVHILVIPDVPAEHVAKRLGSAITQDDVKRTATLFEVAHDLARQLGLRLKMDVFQNADSSVSVGYQHLHLIGERSASLTMPDLDFPHGNRPPPTPRP